MDYYAILELDKNNATHESIADNFRRLALVHHPMKNQSQLAVSQRNFNAICEAYDVLSDATRRQCYDKYGEQGLKNGIPAFNEDTKTHDKKLLGGYCFKGNSFDIF